MRKTLAIEQLNRRRLLMYPCRAMKPDHRVFNSKKSPKCLKWRCHRLPAPTTRLGKFSFYIKFANIPELKMFCCGTHKQSHRHQKSVLFLNHKKNNIFHFSFPNISKVFLSKDFIFSKYFQSIFQNLNFKIK